MLFRSDPECELREIDLEGNITISEPETEDFIDKQKVYPFGISKNKLKKVIKEFKLPLLVERKLDEADVVLTIKGFDVDGDLLKQAKFHDIPVVITRNDDINQIKKALDQIL